MENAPRGPARRYDIFDDPWATGRRPRRPDIGEYRPEKRLCRRMSRASGGGGSPGARAVTERKRLKSGRADRHAVLIYPESPRRSLACRGGGLIPGYTAPKSACFRRISSASVESPGNRAVTQGRRRKSGRADRQEFLISGRAAAKSVGGEKSGGDA